MTQPPRSASEPMSKTTVDRRPVVILVVHSADVACTCTLYVHGYTVIRTGITFRLYIQTLIR